MINLIDLTLWSNRIAAQCPAFGGRVFRTVPDDELTIDRHQSPVAFVYLQDDENLNSKQVENIMQRMTSTVAVEMVLRRTASQADQFDENSGDLIRQYRIEVLNCLARWRPDDAIKPVQHLKGSLNKKENKLLKFVDLFTTENLIKTG